MTRNVLIVDGSAVSRELFSRVLSEESRDMNVVACGSGKQALEAIAEKPFELITTALVLPDMDGLSLCRQIRDQEKHSFTPIIVISGDADKRLQHEGFAAGVTDYFNKSQGARAFGTFIRDFLQRQSSLTGRVLYVEDSQTAATVTKKILERHKLEVQHVVSAEQALQLLKSNPRGFFDLVVTDLSLTGKMSGGDLLHSLRAHLRYSPEELPVLVTTGNDEIQTQLDVFHAGANDFVTKPLVEEVMMARVRLLLTIKHQFDQLRQQAQTMRLLAVTDSLTGVYNRHYLTGEGARFAADRRNQPLWAMIVDIDHFKRINDNYGHLVGDMVLKATGALLRERFADGLPVRFGGEEFAIVLPHATRAQALERAEGLRKAMEALEPTGVKVTVSVGLACSEHHPDADLNSLIGLADKALYAAKSSGRNRIFVNDAGGEILPLAMAAATA
jgi:two-component system cell cycle response regulator